MAFFAGLLVWLQEFAGPDGPVHSVYSELGFGLRWIDVAILGVTFLVVAARLATGTLALPQFRSRGMRQGALMFAGAISLSLVIGVYRGGTELFFDWRNIPLGMMVAFIAYRGSLKLLMLGLIVGMAWAVLNGPAQTFNRSVPVFDGPSVFAMCVIAFLSPYAFKRWGYPISALAGVLVLLSWRRSYWGVAAIALALLVLSAKKSRMQMLFAGAVVVVAGYVAVGQPLIERAKSFNPLSRTIYSTTNEDHIGDVLDAWDVIREEPILGFGLGRTYQTSRIVGWKSESWGVHNAILHVWLRYGLLGLAGFLVFHRGLLQLLWRQRGWSHTFGALWMGLFIMGFGFTPWPYGGLQFTVLLFSLLIFAVHRSTAISRSPLDPHISEPLPVQDSPYQHVT